MKGLLGRYMNELVSLTIMALMTVALIAGQADATVHESVNSEDSFAVTILAASVDAIVDSAIIHADVSIRLELDDIAELGMDNESLEVMRELIDVRLPADD